ncbi:uncharacterized protein RCC_05300 [Ramularia collo-cygni]|uniref:Uncharacterized protein n=1 Tax=Ramularia collo-cygni TaxID=112498 RepID=A0A2D3VCT5_9PEZI|nr:uncharacterized protein RCC_05300 [Ramularia collo-cygni]CZT19449.1 uncharacterized protein RCC_05300 [Ramularia collo-cygni]
MLFGVEHLVLGSVYSWRQFRSGGNETSLCIPILRPRGSVHKGGLKQKGRLDWPSCSTENSHYPFRSQANVSHGSHSSPSFALGTLGCVHLDYMTCT